MAKSHTHQCGLVCGPHIENVKVAYIGVCNFYSIYTICKCGCGLENCDLNVPQLMYRNPTKNNDYFHISYYLIFHPRTSHEIQSGRRGIALLFP